MLIYLLAHEHCPTYQEAQKLTWTHKTLTFTDTHVFTHSFTWAYIYTNTYVNKITPKTTYTLTTHELANIYMLTNSLIRWAHTNIPLNTNFHTLSPMNRFTHTLPHTFMLIYIQMLIYSLTRKTLSKKSHLWIAQTWISKMSLTYVHTLKYIHLDTHTFILSHR